jgi:speckle-type POZ protein
MDSVSMVAATGSYQFKINNSKTKDMGIGECITSPTFLVGEHDWAILYYPQGTSKNDGGQYVSFFLGLQGESKDVTANTRFALLDKDGILSTASLKEFSQTFVPPQRNLGWPCFFERTKLEKEYVKDRYFTLNVTVTLKDESCRGARLGGKPAAFPHARLQKFLKQNKCIDVTFNVGGKLFCAHRFILALHSPVFEAQLLGSTTESNPDLITINEMTPSVWKAMLDFMYSGLLPIDDEMNDSKELMPSISFLQHLLAAADRYAVEKLKDICENKLIDSISLKTVLTFLELSQKHNCRELKKECLKFTVAQDNLLTLVLTEGYVNLIQKYPSLLTEIKEMAA